MCRRAPAVPKWRAKKMTMPTTIRQVLSGRIARVQQLWKAKTNDFNARQKRENVVKNSKKTRKIFFVIFLSIVVKARVFKRAGKIWLVLSCLICRYSAVGAGSSAHPHVEIFMKDHRETG
jgi:hypothetical protein